MAELRITEYVLGKIALNFDEIKAELLDKVKVYETLVYNDTNIREAKDDRAKLNALKKALADERIRRKKEFLEPYTIFENQVKELEAIIDEPAKVIDKQVKEYEERKKAEKQQAIEDYFENYKVNNPCPEWLQSSDIFNPRWLNATCSEKTWQTEMVDRIKGILVDIETIQSLQDYAFEAMQVYKSTLNLAEAMREGKRLADIQKAKEEARKAQELKEQEQKTLADKVRGTGKSPSEAEIEAFSAKVESDKAALEKGKNEGVRRWWVNIRACVTLEQSKDIKGYFEANGIEYTAMTERN